jgi:hypothetical protein
MLNELQYYCIKPLKLNYWDYVYTKKPSQVLGVHANSFQVVFMPFQVFVVVVHGS